jgi:hypothetical protein
MLDAAQKDLVQRYTALSVSRKPLGHPVYAIEHGFDDAKIEQLREAASKELRMYGVLPHRWLVWAALTSEAGYRYRGDEYWPELERHPGEWRNNADRAWVRHWFEKFHAAFDGPEPVGDWAHHFNIIAWPIANAVLPFYLQPHFAEHLFDQRFALAHALSRGAEAIGTILAKEYRGNSARFRIFLRQVHLTGQIVLALREEDLGGRHTRISPDTLTRIVADLEKRQDSKEYLRSARTAISTRQATVVPRLRPAAVASPTDAGVETPIAPVRIAGRLDGSTALLGLIFPDVSTALARSGLRPAMLSGVRIRLPGPTSPWEPGQTMITYAKSDRVLAEVPPSGAPAIVLDGGEDALRSALQPLLTIPECSTWLLKRQSDGLYREVVGARVRPGQSYLILTRQPLNDSVISNIGLRTCRCSTKGVEVYALDIGPNLLKAQCLELESLGIGSATGIRVEPVGVTPAADEEGFPTWHTSEPILLRLSADYEVTGFSLSVDDCERIRIASTDGKADVALEGLEGGRHRLAAQALVGRSADTPTGAIAEFEFMISQPRPWQTAMREKSGFRLVVDPTGAELEAVLSATASLSVLGPTGRAVRWSLETFDAAGRVQEHHEGSSTRVGSPQKDIDAAISRLRQELSDAIDIAHRVDIVASLGVLGRQAIAFPHAVEPIRWTFNPKTNLVRLIDETDQQEPLRIAAYSLPEPVRGRELAVTDALNGVTLDPPGSLLVARRGSLSHAIFVSVPQRSKLSTLRDLKPEQSLHIAKSDAEAVLCLLRSYARWSRARAVGLQAILRKEMTVEEIRYALVARACGPDFAGALRARSFQRAQSLVGGSPGFGSRMHNLAHHEANQTTLEALGACALFYNVVREMADIEDPFRLAYRPFDFRPLQGEAAVARMSKALENRTMVRGAFLARWASIVEPRLVWAPPG